LANHYYNNTLLHYVIGMSPYRVVLDKDLSLLIGYEVQLSDTPVIQEQLLGHDILLDSFKSTCKRPNYS